MAADAPLALSIHYPRHSLRSPSHLPPLNLPKPSLSVDSHRLRSPLRLRLFRTWSLGGGGVAFGMDEGRATADATSGRMAFEPILEEGVFRFDCSGNDKDAAFPSFSFVDRKARETPIAVHKVPEYVPLFKRVHGQQMVKIQLPSGSSFYGTGEVSGPLERTGKRIFTWNTDAWGYGPGTTSLYQSHPWVLALLPDGKALGVLADTTQRCEIDLREDSMIKFTAVAVYPVITFGPFETPIDVLMSLSHAIGFSKSFSNFLDIF